MRSAPILLEAKTRILEFTRALLQRRSMQGGGKEALGRPGGLNIVEGVKCRTDCRVDCDLLNRVAQRQRSPRKFRDSSHAPSS
jgi:hypothetical protein